MKKFLVVLSMMLTCLFGMTACGSETQYTDAEKAKLSNAENYAKNFVSVYFIENMDSYDAEVFAKDYTSEELAEQYAISLSEKNAIVGQGMTMEELKEFAAQQGFESVDDFIDNYCQSVAAQYGMNPEDIKAEVEAEVMASIVEYPATESSFVTSGSVIRGGFSSLNSGLEEMGDITSVNLGEPESRIDGETIIVSIPVVDAERDAEIEVIVSNDKFMELQSFAVNLKYTFGETMGKAGQNTLVGIGTVFVMLILISFIISLFKYIPKIQESFSKKKESPKTEAIEKAVAQIVEKEEAASSEDLTDDLELVAVIAAAIAAYEGQTSTDGFVVRSIRKVNRR